MSRRWLPACALVPLAAVPAAVALWRDGPDPPAAGPPVMSVSVAHGNAAEVTTGFAADGHRVVTVAHVLEAENAAVTVRGRDGVARAGRVVAIDRRNDLAVLEVPGGAAAPALRVAPGRRDLRLVLARPGGPHWLGAEVRRSIIARVAEAGATAPRRRPALEIAAHVEIGDSGAPLVDREGRVAGVLFARSRERTGTAYAVDAEVLSGLLSAAGR